MNTPQISIIIPCYNCEKTLIEAVDSCFVQGVDSFEVILVDDSSTDSTVAVMKKLASKYPEVKLFFHKKNQGGGATRNTATQNALYPIIFCLDSDDLLPPGTLAKMLRCMLENNADGVGVNRSLKFRGTNVKDIERVDTFGYVEEKIPFRSLLEKEGVLCSLYSTFMFTRKSFDLIGGYPTEHGFDTQGFAWRFLMHGLTAYTCKDAEYLHRINFHESYYMREYNAGKLNHNWQVIFEENILVFSKEVQEQIINSSLSDLDISLINNIKSIDDPWNSEAEFIIQEGINSEKNSNLRKEILSSKHKMTKPIPRNSFLGILKRIEIKILKYFGFIVDIIVARHYQPKLIAHFFFHIMRKYFQIGFVTQGEDSLRVDVVIPTIAKDTDLLLTMVNSLKTYIRHTINNIYIVSKNTPEIINLCRENNFIFIDEFELIGYGKEKITYTYKGINRSGWIFQQLLKLSGDKITECDDYIIVDSDTLLINDHHFKNRDKYIFYENEEWHEPYFKSYSKIFGYRPSNRMSFTSHMMIFNRQYLRAMKSEMELLHKKTWDRVYLSTINENEMSCISDYDTYANWVFHNYPENVLRLPLYNRSMPRVHLHNLELLHKEFGKTYKSLSFHSYYGKDIRDIIKESNL